MKRVLIITYYWPPFGGSGVQRWLKFVKYLNDFGYSPVVYTPENPEFMSVDQTLFKDIPNGTEVIKNRIVEPYFLYKFFTGKKSSDIKPGYIKPQKISYLSSLKESLSLFIRGNLFIPDPKILWLCPSIKYLNRYLKENPVNIVVSTGPPHSMHLIAKKISKQHSIPWVADFRDPWTKMFNFKHLKHTWLAKKIHQRLEKGVLDSADIVVTVSPTIRDQFASMSKTRVEVITNGYDCSDFDSSEIVLDDTFSITYTGLFMVGQNPTVLWRALSAKCGTDSNFKRDLRIKLAGNIDISVINQIEFYGLKENLLNFGYLPHKEVVKLQKESRVLLLSLGMEPEAKGIMTGKFFEYIATKRPILAFGPKGGDMDLIMESSGYGNLVDFEDYRKTLEFIDLRYSNYCKGDRDYIDSDASKFSRKSLTKDLVILMDSLIDK